jgi:membrane protease YdiL (CAAX protease family)
MVCYASNFIKVTSSVCYLVDTLLGDVLMSQNKLTTALRRFAFRWPVLFSTLVIIVSGLLTEIPFNFILESWLEPPAPELWKVIFGHFLTGLILVWMLTRLGMLEDAKFTAPGQWRAVWLVWPFLLFTILNLDSLIFGTLQVDKSRPGLIILFVFTNLAIGFAEEVMARGVGLNLLLRKWGQDRRGIYLAVIVSALLFGISHLFNLFTGHLPVLANLTQIGYSIAFGVVFAACFLRNNAIWPVIFMHAVIDFTGGLRHISIAGSDQIPAANNTLEAALLSLMISVPLLLYGLFILRKVEPDSLVCKRFCRQQELTFL